MTNIDHNSAIPNRWKTCTCISSRMWLLVLKIPMPLTTCPFPSLGVGQNRGKPLEKGETPGNTAGPGLGKSAMFVSSTGLQKREVFVTPAAGEQPGWMGSSRQLVPLVVSGHIQERGLQGQLLDSQKLILAVCDFSLQAPVCTAAKGLNRLWLHFKCPSKWGALLHPQVQPCCTHIGLKYPMWPWH